MEILGIGFKTSALLSRATKIKGRFTKERDALIVVNEEIEVESKKLQSKVSEINILREALSDETKSNESVIKNVNKILGL